MSKFKSCWPDELGTEDESNKWETFQIKLYGEEAGDYVEDWQEVKVILKLAGYQLVKTQQIEELKQKTEKLKKENDKLKAELYKLDVI